MSKLDKLKRTHYDDECQEEIELRLRELELREEEIDNARANRRLEWVKLMLDINPEMKIGARLVMQRFSELVDSIFAPKSPAGVQNKRVVAAVVDFNTLDVETLHQLSVNIRKQLDEINAALRAKQGPLTTEQPASETDAGSQG